MKVAIIGGGIAGLVTAWLLAPAHDVTLFERQGRLGGHCRTVDVPSGDIVVPVEVGFRYFTRASHPHVVALMKLLALEPFEHRTSLTIVDRRRDEVVRLPPHTPGELLRLLRSPRRVRELWHLDRLLRRGAEIVTSQDWSQTLEQYVDARRVPSAVADEFLYPFFAAAWGASTSAMAAFPVYDLIKVARGGLRHFLELPGGLRTYVDAIVGRLEGVDVCVGDGIIGVSTIEGRSSLRVVSEAGMTGAFDAVVVATEASVAARILADDPGFAAVATVLQGFRHFATDIAIHGDVRFMPPRRRDWSTCNHFYGDHLPYMTDWPGERAGAPVFRTWLKGGSTLPDPLHHRARFDHLVVTAGTPELQRRLAARQGERGLYLSGTYATDVDHHDSAIASALAVARRLAPRSPRLADLEAAAMVPPGVA